MSDDYCILLNLFSYLKQLEMETLIKIGLRSARTRTLGSCLSISIFLYSASLS